VIATGPEKRVAAVHYAMTNRDDVFHREVCREPVQRFVQHPVQVFGDDRPQRDVVNRVAVDQMQRERRVPEVDRALADPRCTIGRDVEQAYFDR